MCKLLISGVLLMITLSGCFASYATGPRFQEVSAPPAGKALLYIYRVDTLLQMTPTVKIDGVPWVVLHKQGYSYAYIGTGIHRLMLDYGRSTSINMISEFIINGGETICVRIYDGGLHKRIDSLPMKSALAEISEYRYVEPLRVDF